MSSLSAGRTGYRSQVSDADMEDYRKKLTWLQDKERAGVLKRGWKSRLPQSIPYTYTMIVGTLSGRFFSPPVLDAIYSVVHRAVGEFESTDKITRLDNVQASLEQTIRTRDELVAKMEADEADFQRRLEIFQESHARFMAKIRTKLEEIDRQISRLKGDEEYLQMEIEDEYGWTPDQPAMELEGSGEDAVIAS